MGVVKVKITINKPASEVFAYIADLPRHSEWASHPLTIKQTSEGEVAVGSTFDSEGKAFGKTFRDKLSVTEYVPDERFIFDVVSGGARFRLSFLMAQAGDNTTLTKTSETLKKPFFFYPLFLLVENWLHLARLLRT